MNINKEDYCCDCNEYYRELSGSLCSCRSNEKTYKDIKTKFIVELEKLYREYGPNGTWELNETHTKTFITLFQSENLMSSSYVGPENIIGESLFGTKIFKINVDTTKFISEYNG